MTFPCTICMPFCWIFFVTPASVSANQKFKLFTSISPKFNTDATDLFKNKCTELFIWTRVETGEISNFEMLNALLNLLKKCRYVICGLLKRKHKLLASTHDTHFCASMFSNWSFNKFSICILVKRICWLILITYPWIIDLLSSKELLPVLKFSSVMVLSYRNLLMYLYRIIIEKCSNTV